MYFPSPVLPLPCIITMCKYGFFPSKGNFPKNGASLTSVPLSPPMLSSAQTNSVKGQRISLSLVLQICTLGFLWLMFCLTNRHRTHEASGILQIQIYLRQFRVLNSFSEQMKARLTGIQSFSVCLHLLHFQESCSGVPSQ